MHIRRMIGPGSAARTWPSRLPIPPTGAFSVEYTTNLLDWLFPGPATPCYEFTDTNAPAEPQRYYRLRWP